MTYDKDLETFVRLKYLPITSASLSNGSIPAEVLHEFKTRFDPYLFKVILSLNNDKVFNEVESILLDILLDYHNRTGYDYNEHGELPNG